MRNWKIALSALLSVLLLVLILQNTEPVETRFLMITLIMPRAALLLLTGLVGFTIGLLVSLRLGSKRRASQPEA